MNEQFNKDLNWFCKEYRANIHQDQRRVAYRDFESLWYRPMDSIDATSLVRTETAYTITVSERDLAHLVSVVKEQHHHQQMRRRYPGIDQAWQNYLATVYLTGERFFD